MPPQQVSPGVHAPADRRGEGAMAVSGARRRGGERARRVGRSPAAPPSLWLAHARAPPSSCAPADCSAASSESLDGSLRHGAGAGAGVQGSGQRNMGTAEHFAISVGGRPPRIRSGGGRRRTLNSGSVMGGTNAGASQPGAGWRPNLRVGCRCRLYCLQFTPHPPPHPFVWSFSRHTRAEGRRHLSRRARAVS